MVSIPTYNGNGHTVIVLWYLYLLSYDDGLCTIKMINKNQTRKPAKKSSRNSSSYVTTLPFDLKCCLVTDASFNHTVVWDLYNIINRSCTHIILNVLCTFIVFKNIYSVLVPMPTREK